MLSSADLTQMRNDVLDMMSDHDVSVIIRRGATTLAAQTVRLERLKRATTEPDSGRAEEAVASVTIVGSTSLDIERGDRFNAFGYVYEVTAIRPNTQIGVMAEAVIKQ